MRKHEVDLGKSEPSSEAGTEYVTTKAAEKVQESRTESAEDGGRDSEPYSNSNRSH